MLQYLSPIIFGNGVWKINSKSPRELFELDGIWIWIRHIPKIFFTTENDVHYSIGGWNVEEISYDPNISQTNDYIRANINCDVDKPEKATEKLNVPSGGMVTIELKYEKYIKCAHALENSVSSYEKGFGGDIKPKLHGNSDESAFYISETFRNRILLETRGKSLETRFFKISFWKLNGNLCFHFRYLWFYFWNVKKTS